MRLNICFAALALISVHASANPSPTRQATLDNVIELSEKNALNTSRVDWPQARRVATEILQKDASDAGLNAAVHYVLSKLQDRHSSYRPTPTPRPMSDTPPTPTLPIATAALSPGGNPLLVMNSWAGTDSRAAASTVRTELNTALERDSCGIVVDFSPNAGGNMWPMVMGLLPLYSEGTLGAFEDREQKKTSIVSTGDALLVAGQPHFLNAQRLPRPAHAARFVALVIGERTASSGEITALLFRGQDNVRFFGHRTAGVPTSNRTFTLPNGALLALTTATTQDRTGKVYDEALVPDVETDDPRGAADAWLKEACASAQ